MTIHPDVARFSAPAEAVRGLPRPLPDAWEQLVRATVEAALRRAAGGPLAQSVKLRTAVPELN